MAIRTSSFRSRMMEGHVELTGRLPGLFTSHSLDFAGTISERGKICQVSWKGSNNLLCHGEVKTDAGKLLGLGGSSLSLVMFG